MLGKFTETLRIFANQRPSIRELWASRTGSFDRAHAILPSDAVRGEPVTMTVQAWDEYERLYDYSGGFGVGSTDEGATLPDRISFSADDGGVVRGDVTFETTGIQYVTLHDDDTDERFVTNPVRVAKDDPAYRTYWGDIHLHSQYSDGAGSVAKGMQFGRDVMDLDVVAYTDHDTMGFFIPPQWQRRRMRRRYFEDSKALTNRFHEPGEFVTLFGYEWTKQPNMGGHINCYFDSVEEADLFASLDADTRTYEALWRRLDRWRDETGRDVVTIPHHPAEAMYPFDFASTDYDDSLAPLVEVYSQWGSSERPESAGNTKPLKMGQGEIETPGHYIQDALAMGHRVGMMASSDYHGPHPGHSLIHADPHLPSRQEWRRDGLGWALIWRIWNEESYRGGLTAFRAPELTREAIFDSLRRRRVYATTQPDRMLVEFSVNGVRLGENGSRAIVDAPDAKRTVEFEVAGTAPIATATVVKNNDAWRRYTGTTDPDAGLETHVVARHYVDREPIVGMEWNETRGTEADVYYLRVHQADAGMAWAGPIWVDVAT